eukprot:4341910-Prymnesium_polylepis.2
MKDHPVPATRRWTPLELVKHRQSQTARRITGQAQLCGKHAHARGSCPRLGAPSRSLAVCSVCMLT